MDASPIVATKKEKMQNPVVHILYEGPAGKIVQNVSLQLVIKPTAVFRHAKVTMTARMIAPTSPK